MAIKYVSRAQIVDITTGREAGHGADRIAGALLVTTNELPSSTQTEAGPLKISDPPDMWGLGIIQGKFFLVHYTNPAVIYDVITIPIVYAVIAISLAAALMYMVV
jgi:hypothetical protein